MNNLYLIKDIARLSGFSIHTLKYYLKIGLIKESGRSPETNFRYFDNATVEQLRVIRHLRKEKKCIKEIKEALTGGLSRSKEMFGFIEGGQIKR